MIKYRDIETGQVFSALPRLYKNVSPINQSNMASVGIESFEVQDTVIDTTDFDNACVAFRELCYAIRSFTGIGDFKGGFDEMTVFEASTEVSTPEGIALAIKWMALDKLCTYEGVKIGYGQPAWWHKCWESL